MASASPVSLWDILSNPFVTALAGGGLGVMGTVAAAFFNRGPALQQQINDSFAHLIQGYEKRIVDLTDIVKELKDEVVDLNDHIERLNEKLEEHGIEPPQRMRRI